MSETQTQAATIHASAIEPAPMTQSPAEQLAQRNRADEARLAYGQRLEDLGAYAEAGIFYAGKSPIANSLGAELGVVTRDEKTGKVQRSGVGFYLRSDHMCQLPYIDLSTLKVERA
jgi:hypothetical protein